MNILPFQKEHIPEAAGLFIQNFKKLRRAAPLLPDCLEDPRRVGELLENLLTYSGGVAAFENGRMAGCLGWWLVDNFRGTPRRGAYCPEWAHTTLEEGRPAIYRALYRSAAAQWLDSGCQVHAITLLACDREAVDTWFWNGFGLWVVDALRPTAPINAPLPGGYSLRKATPEEVEPLALLEAEHWRHYAQPPTLMVTNGANSAEELRGFINNPDNSAWLAWQGGELAGYLRFENRIDGAAEIIAGPGITGITGAYVRPAHRGRGLAPALLDCALRDYAARGYHACATDFESFNPEAAAFWPRYFETVALSLVRVPERTQA